MDLTTFKGLKSDYVKLYAELGIPYRGESKEQMQYEIMKFGDKVNDDEISHIKAIPAPKKAGPVRKVPVTTPIEEGEAESSAFKSKVTYMDPAEVEPEEPKQKKAPKKAPKQKAAVASEAPSTEPPKRLTWNEFLSSKAAENPTLSRKALMVKYSGEEWTKYKASFDKTD